jgi:hypothetical protein
VSVFGAGVGRLEERRDLSGASSARGEEQMDAHVSLFCILFFFWISGLNRKFSILFEDATRSKEGYLSCVGANWSRLMWERGWKLLTFGDR